MATFGNLIERTLIRLSAMGGLDVQIYMQPKLAEILQQKFDTLFDKHFWRDLTTREVMAIGVDGLPTADVSPKIKRFIDIEYIWLPGYDNPLPELKRDTPITRVTQPCFAPYGDPQKRFMIVPASASSSVEISYRTKLAAFVEDDEVPLDDHMLIMATCSDYLVSEGANLKDAEKFQKMAETRYNDLVKLEQKNEKSLYPASSVTVMDWRDA